MSKLRASVIIKNEMRKNASVFHNQVFHILASVAMAEGTVKVGHADEKTVYSCCINMDKGLYYYTTYQNSRPVCVNLHKEDPDSDGLIIHPFLTDPDFLFQN